MKRMSFSITLLSLLTAAAVVMAGNVSAAGADPSQTFQVNGVVLAVTGGSGSGMPMLTVDDQEAGPTDIALGPIWYLQEAGFSAAAGDQVQVLAFACPICAAPAVAAWIENLSNTTFVDLRDEDARPLWIQRQSHRSGSGRVGGNHGSNGNGDDTPGDGNGTGTGGDDDGNGNGEPGGSGNDGGNGDGEPGGSGDGNGEPGGSGDGDGNGPTNGSGLDMAQIDAVTGVVVDFTGHAGSGQPVLTLDLDGTIVEITVSPYQPLEAAGLMIEPGLILTVTFAPTDCEEDPHNVAISVLDDATGVLVQLRDPETGFPMTNGGGHSRPNWP